MEQRSVEWYEARNGKATASMINDVMATLKDGRPGAGRKNYVAQLVVERLTGQQPDSYCSPAMQWGIDNETSAREAYQFETGLDVVEIGFVDHPSIHMAGCSPDGLVGEDGMVEIKCPNTATHIEWLLSGKVPDKHIKQMQFQMACTGRKWNDFVSHDPRMPIHLRTFIKRLPRDDKLIKEIEASVVSLLLEVEETISMLEKAA